MSLATLRPPLLGVGPPGFLRPELSLCSFTETVGPALGRRGASPSDKGLSVFCVARVLPLPILRRGCRSLSHQLGPSGGTMGSPWQGALLGLLQGWPRPPPGIREGCGGNRAREGHQSQAQTPRSPALSPGALLALARPTASWASWAVGVASGVRSAASTPETSCRARGGTAPGQRLQGQALLLCHRCRPPQTAATGAQAPVVHQLPYRQRWTAWRRPRPAPGTGRTGFRDLQPGRLCGSHP